MNPTEVASRLRTLDLMRLHVEALFVHDDAGTLVRVNEPGGAPAPRFFVGVTPAGVLTRYRSDVDDRMRMALEEGAHRLEVLDVAPNPEPFERILAGSVQVRRTMTGPAFVVPADVVNAPDAVRVDVSNAALLGDLLGAWMPDVEACQPMFAVVVDGRAVSVCASVRQTVAAHEAGVETATAYRGRGMAARAVSAWARTVAAMELTPLYSTSWTNAASQAVARKLGLFQFGNDLHIT